jgi:hypothetical protein
MIVYPKNGGRKSPGGGKSLVNSGDETKKEPSKTSPKG